MNAMPFTSALGRRGANLTTFFAHTPVCCPSRSELLAGRYFHNLKNDGWMPAGCMHVNSSTGTPTGDAPAFATALRAAGYATGLFGKHYNSGGMGHICPAPVGDGRMLVPEGWVEYLGACPDTCYVDCTYNKNGGKATFSDPTTPKGSNSGTSVIGNASLDFVVGMHVLEHTTNFLGAVEQWVRVTKPGGLILIGLPDACDPERVEHGRVAPPRRRARALCRRLQEA